MTASDTGIDPESDRLLNRPRPPVTNSFARRPGIDRVMFKERCD